MMLYKTLLVMFLAFIMELIDSTLGLGYGTILSPFFIIIFESEPSVIIPSILLSQTIASSIAGIFHNKHENISLKIKNNTWIQNIKKGFSQDLKIVFLISILGMIFVIFGAYVSLKIPKIILKSYISLSVMWIGIIVSSKKQFIFSWAKMIIFSMFASFNKGFTGGGFGPILTGGQIISGQKEQSAIGCTTLAQGPVCLTGFIAYILLNHTQGSILEFLIPMTIGASIAAPLGSLIIKEINRKYLRQAVSLLMIFLGIFTFIKTWI